MSKTSRRKKKTPPKPPILGEKDLVKVAPFRAVWTCACETVNTVFFKRRITIGHVLCSRVECRKCSRNYRGMFITDTTGERIRA